MNRWSTLLMAALIALASLAWQGCISGGGPGHGPGGLPGGRPGGRPGGNSTDTPEANADTPLSVDVTVDIGVAWQTGLRVERVVDGDTLHLRDADGLRHRVRLSGIDAPEYQQAGGAASRDALRAFVHGSALSMLVIKHDRYGREVAQVVRARDGRFEDLGLLQIRAGMAWFYRRYEADLPAPLRSRYAMAESAARGARIGLWGDGSAVSPWAWRWANPRPAGARAAKHTR